MTPQERHEELRRVIVAALESAALEWGEELRPSRSGFMADEILSAEVQHFDNHPDPNERALGQMLRNGVEEIPDAGWKKEPGYDGFITSSGRARDGRPEGSSPIFRIALPAEEEK